MAKLPRIVDEQLVNDVLEWSVTSRWDVYATMWQHHQRQATVARESSIDARQSKSSEAARLLKIDRENEEILRRARDVMIAELNGIRRRVFAARDVDPKYFGLIPTLGVDDARFNVAEAAQNMATLAKHLQDKIDSTIPRRPRGRPRNDSLPDRNATIKAISEQHNTTGPKALLNLCSKDDRLKGQKLSISIVKRAVSPPKRRRKKS